MNIPLGTAARNLEVLAQFQPDGESGDHLRAMWAGQSNVLVSVRVRPLMKHDAVKKSCVRVLDSKVVIIMDPAQGDKMDILRANRSREKQYAFDYVFEPGSSQDSCYHHTTKFLIHGVLDGYNATVFAYGQTGSGKTYTMIGTPLEPGIMVRVMKDLFSYSAIQGKQQGVKYKVTVSFLEVYNENIKDLLSDTEEYLDLREDPIKGPVVAGITEVETNSSDEIMQLLHQGNAKRSQAATAANEVSSRSHAVMQVVVESNDRAPGVVANIKVGKLSLVDLAGSERAANTKNVGVRLVEGANINRSLLALGNCINALGEKGNKGNFVPYRDSKLTRLLKDSLGGNCRTVMIANISSAESSFEETLNTLKYANRAKNIKTNVQRNVLNVNYHISEYVQLINNLRGEIKILKDQIAVSAVQAGPGGQFGPNGVGRAGAGGIGPASPVSGLKHPGTPLQMLRESLKSATSISGEARELVNNMRQKIVENFQERMQLRRSLIELEDQNVQNGIEVSKRQLMVVHWSESHGAGEVDPNEGDFSQIIISAPADIKEAWHECEQLRKAISKNNAMKKNIAKRLRYNEKEAEKFRDELSNKITGEDRRELMELQYQVGRLELENMELEQHRIVHESILKGKDLVIQKLKLQLAVRDKLIQRQQVILQDHQLDGLVGFSIALLEQSLLGDPELNFTVAPPSPPRDVANLRSFKKAISMTPRSAESSVSPRGVEGGSSGRSGKERKSDGDSDTDPTDAPDWSEVRSEASENSYTGTGVSMPYHTPDESKYDRDNNAGIGSGGNIGRYGIPSGAGGAVGSGNAAIVGSAGAGVPSGRVGRQPKQTPSPLLNAVPTNPSGPGAGLGIAGMGMGGGGGREAPMKEQHSFKGSRVPRGGRQYSYPRAHAGSDDADGAINMTGIAVGLGEEGLQGKALMQPQGRGGAAARGHASHAAATPAPVVTAANAKRAAGGEQDYLEDSFDSSDEENGAIGASYGNNGHGNYNYRYANNGGGGGRYGNGVAAAPSITGKKIGGPAAGGGIVAEKLEPVAGGAGPSGAFPSHPQGQYQRFRSQQQQQSQLQYEIAGVVSVVGQSSNPVSPRGQQPVRSAVIYPEKDKETATKKSEKLSRRQAAAVAAAAAAGGGASSLQQPSASNVGGGAGGAGGGGMFLAGATPQSAVGAGNRYAGNLSADEDSITQYGAGAKQRWVSEQQPSQILGHGMRAGPPLARAGQQALAAAQGVGAPSVNIAGVGGGIGGQPGSVGGTRYTYPPNQQQQSSFPQPIQQSQYRRAEPTGGAAMGGGGGGGGYSSSGDMQEYGEDSFEESSSGAMHFPPHRYAGSGGGGGGGGQNSAAGSAGGYIASSSNAAAKNALLSNIKNRVQGGMLPTVMETPNPPNSGGGAGGNLAALGLAAGGLGAPMSGPNAAGIDGVSRPGSKLRAGGIGIAGGGGIVGSGLARGPVGRAGK